MSLVRMLLATSAACLLSGAALAHGGAPVSVEVVGRDGRTFRSFPVSSSDGALRSYLEAQKDARYEVRVRNNSGERLGLVIAVDGRNIISGKRSDLARSEPMYVIGAWESQDYSGWRASLDAVNEFYFTDWKDSYAEAFGDRSARGVIAVAVYREVTPAIPEQRYSERNADRAADAASTPPPSAEAGAGKSERARRRDASPGTGYGDRRIDRAVRVEFVAQADPDSRHFIKYEWRETLCRRQLVSCGETNRFWDESSLGFAPPPPWRRR